MPAVNPPIILYRYEASPFARKLENVLLLKGIAHHRVETKARPPRPMISELLGIQYRRIPLLAIGRDVYCDTSLISSVLERRFPASQGYGTLFPPRKDGGKADTGMIKAFVHSYSDRVLFTSASQLLPWDKFSPSFLQDRIAFFGKPVDPKVAMARQPAHLSALSSHLNLLEEQLSDQREWLFDTVTPGFADISIHFLYHWITGFPTSKGLIDEQRFPNSVAWLARTTKFLDDRAQAKKGSIDMIMGDEAARLISSTDEVAVVPLDEIEASRLGLIKGITVSVAPDDTGKDSPTVGTLVGLDREEVVVETQGTQGLVVRCHFPRLGYTVRVASTESKL